jgi:hypothetical protein
MGALLNRVYNLKENRKLWLNTEERGNISQTNISGKKLLFM